MWLETAARFGTYPNILQWETVVPYTLKGASAAEGGRAARNPAKTLGNTARATQFVAPPHSRPRRSPSELTGSLSSFRGLMPLRLATFVPEGECFPPGYGLAWRDWLRPGCVAYPVPLNLVMGWLHDLWLDLRAPKHLRDDVWSSGEHSRAFLRGVEAGRGLR